MSVSISLVRTLLEAVDRAGVPIERVLEQAELPRSVLDDPNARVEAATYDRLQELALDLTGDPALGLHMGDAASVSAFQVVGHLVSHCRSVREAIEVFFRYQRIVADCEPSYLEQRGDDVVLVYHYLRGSPRCSRLRAEFGVARLLRIGAMFGGQKHVPREVWFEHAAPAYESEYHRIFAAQRVRFGQPHTAIVMPAGFLELQQLHWNEQLFAVLAAQAERQLHALQGADSLARKIHHLVVHQFADVEPDMESIARRLGMSSRSLRRHLHAEGRSFSDVVNAAMGELATNVLREPSTTIQEAAYRLGFSDPSAFHRAVKRWTGKTPRQLRQ